jgi:hypothetical protein
MKKIKELVEKYGTMQVLGSDGSCPCGHAEVFGVKIETHCWRSGCESKHPYSCVHVEACGDLMLKKSELNQIARIFAKYIKESYMTEVAIETKIY